MTFLTSIKFNMFPFLPLTLGILWLSKLSPFSLILLNILARTIMSKYNGKSMQLSKAMNQINHNLGLIPVIVCIHLNNESGWILCFVCMSKYHLLYFEHTIFLAKVTPVSHHKVTMKRSGENCLSLIRKQPFIAKI